MSEALVSAYTKYRIKNEKLKSQQKKQREQELQPYLADIGKEISDLQGQGYTITDITHMLGLKNRTFYYDAKRAYKGVLGDTPDSEHDPFEDDNTQTGPIDTVDETDIDWDWNHATENIYDVIVDGNDYQITVEVGGLADAPWEWSEHTAQYRKVYRQIIREVEHHYANHHTE